MDLIVWEVESEIHLDGLATVHNPLQQRWSLPKNESGLVERQLESALIFFLSGRMMKAATFTQSYLKALSEVCDPLLMSLMQLL